MKSISSLNKEFQKVKALTFWKKSKSKFIINPSELKQFLELNGFCLYNDKLIQIYENIAIELNPQQVFNYCLKHIQSLKISDLDNEFMRQGETLLMTKKALLGSLKQSNITPLRDDLKTGYILFNNGILKVTENKKELIDYNHIKDNFIWLDSIIECDYTENNEISVFEKFLNKVTNDDKHKLSVLSSIGFAIHKYKIPSSNKAIILSDENTESENNANGRTGKGLIVQGISKMVNLITQNGKNLDLTNNRFAFQDVTHQTEIIFFDDVKKAFDFEQLFSILTNDITIEKKNKQSFIIPFALSPKIILTTNYQINGNSSSHKGRRFEIYLNNYFNDNHTPFLEFNHHFFNDWDSFEWNKFYNFMTNCLQTFLKSGLIPYNNIDLKQKKVVCDITKELFDKLEKCELNKRYFLKDFDKRLDPIKKYAEFKNYTIKKSEYNGLTTFTIYD
ncbi:hypothetical protein [Faecalibacter rhinopitheci]|uniref:Uncharacterized protein n=1 Tax=Faecalibacter rhinopitheci TaxID=2779678 RepID=A0A8J7FSM7_9FLAO|nr:hypothetical protein [Faecalibacter rhinopitheci]MBF0596907.1 hypothetical protein [Faecalibacter rhinopitheci]